MLLCIDEKELLIENCFLEMSMRQGVVLDD